MNTSIDRLTCQRWFGRTVLAGGGLGWDVQQQLLSGSGGGSGGGGGSEFVSIVVVVVVRERCACHL